MKQNYLKAQLIEAAFLYTVCTVSHSICNIQNVAES